MKRLCAAVAIAATVGVSSPAAARNLVRGFTDIAAAADSTLELRRTYDSASSYAGIFGERWGTDYETFATPLPDGSVVIRSSGNRGNVTFRPSETPEAVTRRWIESLVAVARKTGEVKDDRMALDWADWYRASHSRRAYRWQSLLRKKLVEPVALAEGTLLRDGDQTVVAVAGGIEWKRWDDRVFRFDASGRLVEIVWPTGVAEQLRYRRGRLVEVRSGKNRLRIRYNAAGRVREVRSSTGDRARYRYDRDGRLVRSMPGRGAAVSYEYDGSRLVGIESAKRGETRVTYHRDGGGLRSVREPDGRLEVYSARDTDGGMRRLSSTETFNRRAVRVSFSEWDDRYARTAAGRRYLAVRRSGNGRRTTTTRYNESGTVRQIERDGEVATFRYDGDGNVTRKETPIEIVRAQYHPENGKIIYIERESKQRGDKQWTKYDYDEQGNLSYAEKSDGVKVSLTYDDRGRIVTMLDGQGQTLSFKYNRASKPIEITLDGVGTLTVQYDARGEIKKVDSPAGHRMALQVTQSFQRLLDLTRAGRIRIGF